MKLILYGTHKKCETAKVNALPTAEWLKLLDDMKVRREHLAAKARAASERDALTQVAS